MCFGSGKSWRLAAGDFFIDDGFLKLPNHFEAGGGRGISGSE